MITETLYTARTRIVLILIGMALFFSSISPVYAAPLGSDLTPPPPPPPPPSVVAGIALPTSVGQRTSIQSYQLASINANLQKVQQILAANRANSTAISTSNLAAVATTLDALGKMIAALKVW